MTKEQALLEFLKEQGHEYTLEDLEQCSYDESSFDVNPHTTRYGASPSELVENAERVRAALAELFPTVKQESWNSSRVNRRVYRILDKRLKAQLWPDKQHEDRVYKLLYKNLTGNDSPPVVPEGRHDNERAKTYQDIVNFFFCLAAPKRKGHRYEPYSKAIQQAFDTGAADEYREIKNTQDFTYLVLTDDEAEERAREYASNIIDDCYDLPEHLEHYFDRERFVDDCVNIDGRGVQLAGWDHEEHEQGEYYIYRTN